MEEDHTRNFIPKAIKMFKMLTKKMLTDVLIATVIFFVVDYTYCYNPDSLPTVVLNALPIVIKEIEKSKNRQKD